jgi:chitinase
MGINNIWHDKDTSGNEIGAGSNPMWHAKNLQEGIAGSYLSEYGFPTNTQLSDQYNRYYDDTAESPWLWNAKDNVFISIEDEQSMAAKVQYVIDKGVGGIMFWELAGDYAWHADRNNGNGEYYIGETLTTIAYNAFANAPAYGSVTADNISKPEKVVDLSYDFDGFKTGDNNYPINPTLRIRNNGSLVIPGGTVIEFNMPTATSDIITDQSGMGLSVVESGSNSAGNNVGGLENTFHRVRLTLPAWQSLEAGSEVDVTMNYYLPVPLPTGFRVIMNGQELGTTQEFPNLPLADGADSGGDNGNGGDDGNDTGSCSTSGIPLYPDFPQKDWAGNPSHANSGDTMIHNSAVWEALWWTKAEPGSSAAWKLVCNF